MISRNKSAKLRNSLNLRYLSFASILLGVLGGAVYWWAPMGLVLSLSGLILGFLDWTRARRQSLNYRLSIVGIVVSLATLIFAIVIMALGLEIVTFGGR